MTDLGDHMRLRAHPKAPALTVDVLYLQGEPEQIWAGCRWKVPGNPKATPQLVHFPVSELEATP